MPIYTVVTVFGVPSLDLEEFGQSITFRSREVSAPTREDAMLDAGPADLTDPPTDGLYQVLNWYTFPDDEEASDA